MAEKEYCYQIYQVKPGDENGYGMEVDIRIIAREGGLEGKWYPVDRFDSIDEYKKAIRKSSSLLKRHMDTVYGY